MSILMMSCASLKELCKKEQLLKPEEFNFENSTALARHQTELLNKYKNHEAVSDSEIKSLENNLWVKSAVKLAPGNLVVRQWCLIDLLRNNPAHARDIHRLTGCLSYNKQLWAEGYSYFLYTREILDVWVDAFPTAITTPNIKEILSLIDMGFMRTAYKRDVSWYPVPFGDVRDQPLDSQLQAKCDSIAHEPCTAGPVTMVYGESPEYNVVGQPIGMNTHIPKDNYTIQVVYGIPYGYVFYTGYENKYKNKEEEARDLLDPKRLNTIQSTNDCD
jgi:hypothetical protein